ncbi:unnamed protein product [Auanema sp. JU1783]|nr:unnamed protein product [Auanema sp. JU1783]
MPMEPMDIMWMAKAPTVNDVVSKSNIVFKPAVGQQTSPTTTVDAGDNDFFWKPSRMGRLDRTLSAGSNEDLHERKTSFSEGSTSSPVECRQRRMSLSGILGNAGGFNWGQNSSKGSPVGPISERRMSFTEDTRLKDLMKHQTKILGDDGAGSAFKRKDYTISN